MTQGQQSRYLKIGGVFFLVGLLLFLFSSVGETGVGNLVKSSSSHHCEADLNAVLVLRS